MSIQEQLQNDGWSAEGANFLVARQSSPRLAGWFKRHFGLGHRIGRPRATKSKIPTALRWAVWERDNFTCKRCGSRRDLTCDHIVPESQGGPTIEENLQTLCRRCNSRKGTRNG